MEPIDASHQPGWYPHSSGAYEAYWDGQRWTGQTRPMAEPGSETEEPIVSRAMLQVFGFVGIVLLLFLLVQGDGLGSGLILLVLPGVALYFFPTFLARRKPKASSVFVVNLFLGWTLIGWVVALAMAVSNPTQTVVVQQPEVTRPSAPTQDALPVSPQADERICPYCAETIKAAAVVCKHCGRDLPTTEV